MGPPQIGYQTLILSTRKSATTHCYSEHGARQRVLVPFHRGARQGRRPWLQEGRRRLRARPRGSRLRPRGLHRRGEAEQKGSHDSGACHPPFHPGNGRRHRSGWRIGRAYRSSPSSEHRRARAFGGLASRLRRVVGRRRDTSPRKTETLKPFSSVTNFPVTLADLRPSQSTLFNSPATSASATRGGRARLLPA